MDKAIANIELEKKLLSALMLKDGAAVVEVAEWLYSRYFYRPEHRLIYKAICALHEANVPINLVAVIETLDQKRKLERAGGYRYLMGLQELEHTTARVEYYAKTIQEKAVRRRLLDATDEIDDAARDESLKLEEALDRAEAAVLKATAEARTREMTAVGEIMQEVFEIVQERVRNPKGIIGVPSGLLDLDRVLGGYKASDLILLAARPSMGKTALALNACRAGNKVAIYSLEMSRQQIGMRLLSSRSGLNSQYLQRGNVNEEEMRRLVRAVEEISLMGLHIDDTAGISLMELRSKARRLKHDDGLDMVIIDYLQLMSGTRAENRQQEISEISRGLKGLARELDIPVLALSQLSRSVEQRAEKKPQLSDLRESGALEQDADVVMFLYREEYYNKEEEAENIAEIVIAKNRNGPTTSVRLQFDKDTLNFRDLTSISN